MGNQLTTLDTWWIQAQERGELINGPQVAFLLKNTETNQSVLAFGENHVTNPNPCGNPEDLVLDLYSTLLRATTCEPTDIVIELMDSELVPKQAPRMKMGLIAWRYHEEYIRNQNCDIRIRGACPLLLNREVVRTISSLVQGKSIKTHLAVIKSQLELYSSRADALHVSLDNFIDANSRIHGFITNTFIQPFDGEMSNFQQNFRNSLPAQTKVDMLENLYIASLSLIDALAMIDILTGRPQLVFYLGTIHAISIVEKLVSNFPYEIVGIGETVDDVFSSHPLHCVKLTSSAIATHFKSILSRPELMDQGKKGTVEQEIKRQMKSIQRNVLETTLKRPSQTSK